MEFNEYEDYSVTYSRVRTVLAALVCAGVVAFAISSMLSIG